jgi:hypothetical protein
MIADGNEEEVESCIKWIEERQEEWAKEWVFGEGGYQSTGMKENECVNEDMIERHD